MAKCLVTFKALFHSSKNQVDRKLAARTSIQSHGPCKDKINWPKDKNNWPKDKITAPRIKLTGPRIKLTRLKIKLTGPRIKITGPRIKALPVSLRVGFCDEWKRGFALF